jgi:peptidylprolyl isomerase/peptidyl-prolyl cis-trans isomerase B (cyclophilin B)
MFTPDGYSVVAPLSETRQTSFRQADFVLEQNKQYQAVMETNKGRMVIDLYQDQVPQTVNNFVFLALHQYYDGIVFHRVLEGFMAQTGDPTGSGRGGPGYTFADEMDASLNHGEKGILSMANAGPNTNGSQIFILFAPQPHLDGKHAVFGKVVEGLEVLDKLQRVDPMRPGGSTPDVIEKLYIISQ